MSDLYIENPDEDSFKTYNKKTVYNIDTFADIKEYGNLIDFNLGEKFFYGKVQRNFVPMYFDNTAIKLKPLTATPSQGASYAAMSFVADAFEKLTLQFSRAITANKIYADEQYLSNIVAHKAYTDPVQLYNAHLISFTESLVEKIKSDETTEIKNFDDFLVYFKNYVFKSCHEIPFTFSAYLKSKYCPMTASGLVIEIADLDYFNDNEKMTLFYRSKNWEFFLNACRSYGFAVDKNIPWRIIADIASQPMLQYAQAYGLGKTDIILNSGFARPEMLFIKRFRAYLLDVYNRIVENELAKLKSCKNGLIVSYVKPKRYNAKQFNSFFSDAKMLKLFFDIRFVEDPKDFTKEKKDDIIRKCLEIYSPGGTKGISKSLGVFEKIINQPFDYHGSSSYLYGQYIKGYGAKIVLSKPRR